MTATKHKHKTVENSTNACDFFTWLTGDRLRNQLCDKVVNSITKRKEDYSQKSIGDCLGISLTKIKEIEKGVCKDFNAINNYINYFGEPLI